MAEKLNIDDEVRRTAVKTDPGAARVVTSRRKLMLGAAAILPSVVTLPSGAQTSAQSFNCKASGDMLNNMGRFTEAPDEWLRKKVFSGHAVRAGRKAYCTTWDQQTVMAIASLEKADTGMVYKAVPGTTWATGPDAEDAIKIGTVCPPSDPTKGAGPASYCYAESIENISTSPDAYAMVFVDEAGLSTSLEPGPGLSPVRATCWASLAASRGTNLG